jgi:methionyl-tRNA formyltransferase
MQEPGISRIILLTGETEAAILSQILRGQNPALDIIAVTRPGDLAAAKPGPGTRLISFCSPVIVPKAFLAALPGPSYNFHPGPPDRPGRYPSVFALYEDARQFGVTIHEMAALVDSGPIVMASWFEIPPGCDLAKLEELTLLHLVSQFHQLAPHLVKAESLPHMNLAWRGRKTRKADCDALCTVTPDMDPLEAERRRRACGPHMLRKI